jgi:hypothetical protein
MNINLKIRFNLTGGKVHDDQATTTDTTDATLTTKRVRFAKNDNTYDTHKDTADKAEEILNPKK